MTQYPECYLARETGICYSAVAMITDYDVGIKEKNLSMERGNMGKVLVVFNDDIAKVKKLIFRLIDKLPIEGTCGCSKNRLGSYYEQ